jgi:N-acetylneuraminic acid mutarotase
MRNYLLPCSIVAIALLEGACSPVADIAEPLDSSADSGPATPHSPDGGGTHDGAPPHSEGGATSDGGTGDGGSGAAVAVLYGGTNSTTMLGDTWLWDGAWTKVSPATTPGPRSDAASATLDGTPTLFGGYVGADAGNDTWTWNGSTWKQVSTTGPSPRLDPAMGSLGSSLLLFGGQNPPAVTPADTWLWDGSSWAEQSAFFEYSGEGWSAAGFDGTVDIVSGNALYVWSGSSWNGRAYSGGPSNSGGAAAAALGGNIVVFGGVSNEGFQAVKQTWTFDGKNWTLQSVANPPARAYASMVTVGDKVVLFGGENDDTGIGQSPNYLGDTWTWDGSSWTEVPGPGPGARSRAVMMAY